ncbi:ATP-binding protein [Flavisolibacter nicotianae]|uniref:ATP-binding protein n=1 Tax=Flavisolibacter nicotianae TaxID=2364882 RepID=UPI000EAFD3AD|nr:ATP-binding protein [Flavisolibacter nicotianae]
MQATSFGRQPSVPEFLAGGGEMGERIRNHDWSKTPLGPVETWPQSLRTCLRIMLTSRQPIWIGWGKDLIKFYNDPYKAIVGGKHPWALGQPASVVWKDIWKDIEPMLRQVMEKDEGTYVESQLLIMERNGYAEETYYTFSYTPIPGDDGRTAGMFCANTDDTDKIISERQLRTLTHLGKRLADCKSSREVIEKTIATLTENPHDFPFALFRLVRDGKAVLEHSTPLGAAEKIIQKEVDLSGGSPITLAINKTLSLRQPQVYEGLKKDFGELPKGTWEVPPNKCIVIPILQAGMKDIHGMLIVGINPYRLLDEKYSSFFSLIADQIATSFSEVHVLEEERKRAEALAEIDRAKTTFFSNISHEFRTPLTLLLGPIEEILHDPATISDNKVRADVAFRNALRMQRLVNTLLEFSRIEAGRVEGRYSLVDICLFTKELASTFRSAIEKAGLQLHFSCTNVKANVYVDPDMWEKIVLNLLSNAFKYTREGQIAIRVAEVNARLELSVSDTGVGIPEDQKSKIFDRFHRIENIQGRSQEGTGIGLALVKELVKLHGGTISVDSQPGKGSIFTVSIPTGKAHLPADKIVGQEGNVSLSQTAVSFVEEAKKWLPAEEAAVEAEVNEDSFSYQQNKSGKKYKVLLADDNADMRDYVRRLLTPQFDITTAVDGEDAFRKLMQDKPDLLLSDIMMPRLDGIGLLQKIRRHPDVKTLPVVFLSARAGEEAKVEGLEAGADDYLVKPFSAKELLARVDTNIKIAESRKAAENNLRNSLLQSPVAMAILRGNDFVIELANTKALELWGKSYEEVMNKPALEAFAELQGQGFEEIFNGVFSGTGFKANEMPLTLIRHGKPENRFINFIYEPLRNTTGEVEGIIAVGIDVTDQVIARRKIEQSEKELAELANAVPQLVWVAEADGRVIYYNDRITEVAGAHKKEDGSWFWQGLTHPDDTAATEQAWRKAVKNGTVYQVEHRIQMNDGTYRWYLSRGLPFRNENGTIVKWFGSATDIHAAKEQATILEEEVRKRTAELSELNLSLQRSNNELQQFAHVASHDLKEPLRKIKTFTGRLADDPENSLSEKSRTFLQKINSASDRMVAMVEGVLNYSVINTSEQVIEPVSLETVLQSIETDLEILVSQKKAVIRYENLPVVDGSFVLLYQLFYNLVNNSLKFSKPDVPPDMRIGAESFQAAGEEWISIRVDDNGIGFDQAYAEKIFESFTRLNSKDHFEGTGLGLSLCKRIVERHGGSIEATGRPGQGASFLIRLPARQTKKAI